MPTIKEARNYARNEFLASQFLNKNEHNNDFINEYNENSAFLDADILISHVIEKNRAWILSHYDEDFSAYFTDFLKLVKQRANGLPIAYITGLKEFYGRTFFVSPAVLIPKPDTEILVEEALHELKIKLFSILAFNEMQKVMYDTISGDDFNLINEELSILDICTGSGCIGLSILAELNSVLRSDDKSESLLPKINLVLADISEPALEICKKNAYSLLARDILNNVYIKKLDLRFDDFGSKYDIITANPPYVPSKLTDTLLEDGRSEPRLALDGGEDGLVLIKPLAKKIQKSLKPNGYAFIELGEYNISQASEIFKNTGFSSVQIKKDLSGQPRILKITY